MDEAEHRPSPPPAQGTHSSATEGTQSTAKAALRMGLSTGHPPLPIEGTQGTTTAGLWPGVWANTYSL